jgi:cobalt-zinc-cadmium efflux system protein
VDNCDHHQTKDNSNTRRLLWALGVIVVFMVVEIIGGILSGSLALLADATHMLTDGLALALAASAQMLAARPADNKLHFGYRRTQVLSAFVNGIFMAVLLAWIVYEAIRRSLNPIEINAPLMLGVAIIGLGANVVAFFILHRPGERDLNMRGAMLHVIGDLMGSVAAIIAAIVIWTTGWMQIDPLLSLLVACLIGVSAFRLVRESGFILLEGAPSDIDIAELADGLKNASPLICSVHHVQISQITPDKPRLTLHACVDNAADAAAALAAAKEYLDQKYDIHHSTIQVEVGGQCPDQCRQADELSSAPSAHRVVSDNTVSTAQTGPTFAAQKP